MIRSFRQTPTIQCTKPSPTRRTIDSLPSYALTATVLSTKKSSEMAARTDLAPLGVTKIVDRKEIYGFPSQTARFGDKGVEMYLVANIQSVLILPRPMQKVHASSHREAYNFAVKEASR